MQGRVFPESKLKFTDGQDAAAVPQLEIEEAEIDWIAGASHHLDFQILVSVMDCATRNSTVGFSKTTEPDISPSPEWNTSNVMESWNVMEAV
jgi:hypothetical protein